MSENLCTNCRTRPILQNISGVPWATYCRVCQSAYRIVHTSVEEAKYLIRDADLSVVLEADKMEAESSNRSTIRQALARRKSAITTIPKWSHCVCGSLLKPRQIVCLACLKNVPMPVMDRYRYAAKADKPAAAVAIRDCVAKSLGLSALPGQQKRRLGTNPAGQRIIK